MVASMSQHKLYYGISTVQDQRVQADAVPNHQSDSSQDFELMEDDYAESCATDQEQSSAEKSLIESPCDISQERQYS